MKFTETHEWIDVQGNIGTVGISHYAQNELGDVVYVELPQIGKKVKQGGEVAVVESTKAAADVYSPVSGEIKEVNHTLESTPELLNTSPEKDGWLFKIALSDPKELDSLIDANTYQSQKH
jgi:glycine cleavage system H protein